MNAKKSLKLLMKPELKKELLPIWMDKQEHLFK